MIPVEVLLSPENYGKLVCELAGKLGRHGLSSLQLSQHLALPVSIQTENTDVVVLKELTPNPCPICHRWLAFLRETIERFEDDSSELIRCPMGHRYPGVLKVYYLNVLQPTETNETQKEIKMCPECGSKNIHYLSPKVMFCLDCDWDSGLEARY